MPIRISTAMGTQLSLNDNLNHEHFLLAEENNQATSRPCPQQQPESVAPDFRGFSREQALWSQKGWVAVDEMNYYMHMLESYHPSSMYGVTVLPNGPDAGLALAKTLIHATSTSTELPRGMGL